MQKVVGSSPIIRFTKALGRAFLLPACERVTALQAASQARVEGREQHTREAIEKRRAELAGRPAAPPSNGYQRGLCEPAYSLSL
jgi:hypothetical protein